MRGVACLCYCVVLRIAAWCCVLLRGDAWCCVLLRVMSDVRTSTHDGGREHKGPA